MSERSEIRSIPVDTFLNPFPSIYDQGLYTRKAPLICPRCKAKDDLYNTEKGAKFDSYYCPGDQPLEFTCTGLLGGEHTHSIVCAGVLEPHLHIKCEVCGSQFLLHMPPELEEKK